MRAGTKAGVGVRRRWDGLEKYPLDLESEGEERVTVALPGFVLRRTEPRKSTCSGRGSEVTISSGVNMATVRSSAHIPVDQFRHLDSQCEMY